MAVIVTKVPDLVRVTLWPESTPAVKTLDCNGVTVPPAPPPVSVKSTVPVKLVTVLLRVSWAVTTTLNDVPAVWGPIAANENFAKAPGFTVNGSLVTDNAGLVVAVRDLLPTRLTLRLLKVATPVPETVFWGVVPLRVPLPLRAMLTDCPPTPLPNWSVTVTLTVNVAPAVTGEDGCCEKEMLNAVAALTVSTCVAEVMIVGEVLAAVIVGVPA